MSCSCSHSHQGHISKEMTFAELLKVYPEATDILLKHGLHCIGCALANAETLEQGASVHGIVGKKFDKMMDELRQLEQNKEK